MPAAQTKMFFILFLSARAINSSPPTIGLGYSAEYRNGALKLRRGVAWMDVVRLLDCLTVVEHFTPMETWLVPLGLHVRLPCLVRLKGAP